MPIEKKSVLYSGKAKTLYDTNDPDLLIAEFRDDTTAFDGVKHEKLTDKGMINNKISEYLMQCLAQEGVPTHFIEKLSDNEIVVKRLRMIPLESVVRNVAAGSLCRRLGIEEKKSLTPPLLEFFLKNDELHDPLITEAHALAFGWATQDQMNQIKSLTLKINDVMQTLFKKAGMILVDAKFEFGIGSDGKMYLGDEISPDACRIWDIKTLESLDKDRFRKDLGNVVESYKEIASRFGLS